MQLLTHSTPVSQYQDKTNNVSEEEMQNCKSKCPAKETDLDSIHRDYPNLDYSKCDDLQDILNGKVVGRNACHAWFEEQKPEVHNAKIEKLRKNKVYRVAYWLQSEEYDDATDYDMPMYYLATDLLHKDLVYC